MEQPTGYQCKLAASLDRAWYLPGDQVRGECFLTCYSELAVSKPGALKPLFLRDEDNFFCADASTFMDEDGEKAVLVHSLSATVESRCDENPKLLRLNWDSGRNGNPSAGDVGERADGGLFTALLPARRSTRHTLFCSPKLDIISGTPLSNGECTGMGFSFRLPECAAPSFIGDACQLTTTMQFSLSWRVRRGKASSTVQSQTLAVPIRIVSAPSSVPLMIATAAPLLRPDSPLTVGNYDFVAWALPAVPTTKLMPSPWNPVQEANAATQKLGWLASRAAQRERFNSLVSLREPADFRVVIPGSACEVFVQLSSTHVCLGETLTGFVAVCETASDAEPSGPSSAVEMIPPQSQGVLVKVDATIEQSECCRAGATPIEGEPCSEDADLICLRTTVMDRSDWTTMNGSRSAFKFFFCPHFEPTLSSDVITNLWRLRLSCVCTSQSYADREAPRGFPILLSSPELIVPLTLSPSPLRDSAPVGPLYS